MQPQPAQPQAITPPSPMPGESYEDFIVRAHQQLLHAIPEPADRNAAVWALWEQTNGDPERQRAAQRFTDDKYITRPMVPLFIEHDKVGRAADGSEVITHYNVRELAGIIRENNARIEDTDAYTGLVDRHTVPAGARDPMPPKTLGFVGPFRLGMLGRNNPRWAIFGDEHHRRDRITELADRPRRSVEVLRLKANGRRYIDPIAALSEAPRLPLPVHHYDASEGGAIVERYSAVPVLAAPYGRGVSDEQIEQYEGVAMAYPGGSNTFVTRPVKTKTRYACGSQADKAAAAGVGRSAVTDPTLTDDKTGENMLANSSDTDNVVRQVIDALQNTEEWQALQQLVDMIQSGQIGPDAGPEAEPGGMPPAPEEGLEAGLGEAGMPAPPEAAAGEMPAGLGQEPAGLGQEPGGPPPMPGTPAGAEAAPVGVSDPNETVLGGEVAPEPDKNVAPVLAAAGRVAAPLAKQALGSAAVAGGQRAGQNLADRLTGPDRNGGNSPTAAGQGLAAAGEAAQQTAEAGSAALDKVLQGPMPAARQANSRYQAATRFSVSDPVSNEAAMSTAIPEIDVERFAAVENENHELRTQLEELTERYQAVETELADVTAHNQSILTEQAEAYAALQHQVVGLTQAASDATRRERLADLAFRFPVVNADEEAERCLYSAGAEMSDDDFEKHVDTIERYAAQAQVASPMVPIGVAAGAAPGRPDVQTARYHAEVADTAMAIVNDAIRKGDRIGYAEAVKQAEEQLQNN